jgi:hypothetical protein
MVMLRSVGKQNYRVLSVDEDHKKQVEGLTRLREFIGVNVNDTNLMVERMERDIIHIIR